jgi:septum formation inhibitor-activating ATPase MinD
MEVIMLTGDSNKGKTATLHFVHEILVNNGAKTTLVEHVGSKDQRDFSSVLKYKDKTKEKTIKIFSMGDVKNALRKTLSDTTYDLLICACNNVFNNCYQQATHRIDKTIADTNACRLSANWYDANRIIGLLDKIIK